MANEFVVRNLLQILSVAAGATETQALLLSSNGNVVTKNYTDLGYVSGYSGYSGVSGTSGASGTSGKSGRSGYPAANSLKYEYEGLVTAPASGKFGLDSATFGSVNKIYISRYSVTTSDALTWLDTALDYVNQNPNRLVIKITKQGDNSIYGVYLVEYASDSDTYFTFNVTTVLAANSTASATTVYAISWMRLGENGKYGGNVMNYYHNVPWNANSTTISLTNNSSAIAPFILPKAAAFDFVRLEGIYTNTGSTTLATTANQNLSFSGATTWYVGIYTRNDGVSSAGVGELELVASASNYVGFAHSLSANAANGSYWTLSRSYYYPANGSTWLYNPDPISASNTNISLGTASMTGFTGTKFIDIKLRTTLPEGNYWIMVGRQQGTSTNATNATGLSRMYVSDNACMIGISQLNMLPGLMDAAYTATLPMFLGLGRYAPGITSMPGQITMSSVYSSTNNNMVSFQLIKNTVQ